MENINAESPQAPEKKIAQVIQLIGQPNRIRILLAIGKRDVCVCHLEAVLGQRQAMISQHLMHLREAGLVIGERCGHYMFYRLADPDLIDLIRSIGSMVGEAVWIEAALSTDRVPGCTCPECSNDSPCARK